MRAAITGASGLVGGNLARELVRQGYAVRAIRRSPASIAHLADQPKDAKEALIVAEHLINRVDIPKGLVRDYTNGGKPLGDYTQWTTFRDHANKVYFWKTYTDPALRAVDLKQLDFSPGQSTRTLSIAIYDRMQAFDDRAAGVMAATLLVISVVTLMTTTVLSRRVVTRRG